jgi:AmpD protein
MTFYSINKGWLTLSSLQNMESEGFASQRENITQCEKEDSVVEYQYSSHCDLRPEHSVTKLLVVHNISLPPGEFSGNFITDLFMGNLDANAHPYFQEIYQLRVSAHCLIRRDGHIIQYVPFNKRAWHAGISNYQGDEKCNDFSIGIELEGTDYLAYTEEQYQQLAAVTKSLLNEYPEIQGNIVGHCDIAPGRKTDPGQSFDWTHYQKLLNIMT